MIPSAAQHANMVVHLGLERTACLLNALGNPQDSLAFVHVAGTNGKGSVCAFLTAILEEAGYKTGRYLSPELLTENERIAINGKLISDGELAELFAEIQGFLPKVQELCGEPPSPFEIWTAAAFLYFARQKCSLVVCEAGLGGRLDATNCIPAPVLAVLTRIAKDHQKFLGSSLQKIAAEKSAIIKKSSTALTLPQGRGVLKEIQTRCQEQGSPLLVIKKAGALPSSGIKERFSYKHLELQPSLIGAHQIENACLAAEAALFLSSSFPKINAEAVEKGIFSAKHPGRFEIFGKNLVFDGAHNPNGCSALAQTLERYASGSKIHIIFAAMSDKNIISMLKCFTNCSFAFTTAADNPRALSAEALYRKAAKAGIEGKAYPCLQDALNDAPKGGLTVVCGSLYLYKEFMACVKEENLL